MNLKKLLKKEASLKKKAKKATKKVKAGSTDPKVVSLDELCKKEQNRKKMIKKELKNRFKAFATRSLLKGTHKIGSCYVSYPHICF